MAENDSTKQDPIVTLNPKQWSEVEGIEDPDILREIDAEFAELTQEIERIAALEHTDAEAQVAQLLKLRQERLEKDQSREDMPPWQRRLHESFDVALQQVIAEALKKDGSGQIRFNLDGDSLQRHGGPVIEALKEGAPEMLAAALDAILNPKPKTPAAKPSGRRTRADRRREVRQATRDAAAKAARGGEDAPKATPVHVDDDGKINVVASTKEQSKINVKIDVASLFGALLSGAQKTKEKDAAKKTDTGDDSKE